MKRIITKDNKNYIQVETKWECFSQFCNRLKTELGETLFAVCNPIQEDGRTYVHIPFENKNRMSTVIQNYSGTELSAAYFNYHS